MNKPGVASRWSYRKAAKLFDSCTRASEPYIAPDPDLTDALLASIAQAQRCVTCGDPLDMDDADNFTRPAGANKPGRTDCGRCVRGMRRNDA